MTRAVFKDTDGRWTYVMGETEYDLGFQHSGRYIWAAPIGSHADPKQVCDGGGWRGNTLSWPYGKTILESARQTKDRLGRPMTVYEYEDLPDADILKFLARALGATPYKSRNGFERNYKVSDQSKVPVKEPTL